MSNEGSKSTEDLIAEARNFFNYYKKEIGKVIRSGNRVIIIDFDDVASFSHALSEALISSPEEVIQIMEVALEESGLVGNPKVLLNKIPENRAIPLSDIRAKHRERLVSVMGKIIVISKPYVLLKSAKFECPSCGKIINNPQTGKKIQQPARCLCGRKGNFSFLEGDYEDCIEVTIYDGNNEKTIRFFYPFTEPDFIKENLGLYNLIKINGIIKTRPSEAFANNLMLEIEPIGLELIEKADPKDIKIEEFLDTLKDKGNKGAYLFEEYIALLFEKKGYKSRATQKSGDKGIDVVAERGNEKIAIQCKLLQKESCLPLDYVQKALGSAASPYKANKMILVTTAERYSPNAEEQYKESKIPFEIWNRKRLIAEIKANILDLEEGWKMLDELDNKNNPYKAGYEEHQLFDIDRIAAEVSHSYKGKIIVVREAISRIEGRMGKLVSIEELQKELEEKMTNEEIMDCIKKLKDTGDIFEPRKGYIQRV